MCAAGCGGCACGVRELARHPVPCGFERGAIDRDIPLNFRMTRFPDVLVVDFKISES